MKLTCPASACRADNDPEAEECERCGTPLCAYARLSAHPGWLFNQGLELARKGNLGRARDLFAAVVYWCPVDTDARNALAMACSSLGDSAEARHHWEAVLAQVPSNTLAARGIEELEKAAQPQAKPPARRPSKRRSKKRRSRSRKRR